MEAPERAAEEARAPGSELQQASQAIIYGDDDRLEVYQHPSALLRAITQSSVVALIPRARFVRNSAGDLALFAQSLAGAFNVCPEERFSGEPTAADCSGVLLDEDLVLTAAHCFQTDDDCDRYAFMFDYYYRANKQLESVSWGDIYGCRRIVARTLTPRGETPRIDFAVVQLDRVPPGRTPVTPRTTPLVLGELAAVIGSTSGLPAKIDSGGRVLDARRGTLDYFLLDSDTFQGSSGSGVFDGQGQLLGTLVRGGEDYVDSADAACKLPNVVSALEQDAGDALKLAPDGGMIEIDAEEATYVARAIDGVCTSGWPSERLCETKPRCGDSYCNIGETRDNCPVDCGCAYGACLDGGNYPAATSQAREKMSWGEGGGGCSALPSSSTQRAGGSVWLALALSALRTRSRRSGRRSAARA